MTIHMRVGGLVLVGCLAAVAMPTQAQNMCDDCYDSQCPSEEVWVEPGGEVIGVSQGEPKCFNFGTEVACFMLAECPQGDHYDLDTAEAYATNGSARDIVQAIAASRAHLRIDWATGTLTVHGCNDVLRAVFPLSSAQLRDIAAVYTLNGALPFADHRSASYSLGTLLSPSERSAS